VSLRERVKVFLARRGLVMERRPPSLAARPERALVPTLELLVAHRLLQRAPRDFFFVQIGAFDGRSGDPLYPLVARYRFRGVLVEPRPEAFRRLRETYRDHPQLRLLAVAVGAAAGRRTLYSLAPRPGLPAWAPQVASFNRRVLLAHRTEIPDLPERIVEEEVEVRTFSQLMAGDAGPLDLLLLDTEGHDWEILRTVDLDRYRPAILQYEHKHLAPGERDAAAVHLLGHGYRLAVSGADTLGYRDPP
jgi:FkbM family methyltransferase